MTFTHDEYVLAILQLGFTAEQYLEAILRLEAEFAFKTKPDFHTSKRFLGVRVTS